eukprot:247643_1
MSHTYLQEKERSKIVVTGYIRQFQNNNQLFCSFSVDLIQTILLFYPIHKWEFTDKKINNITILNGYTLKYSRVIASAAWVSVQIGDFFSIKDKCIHTITLKGVSDIKSSFVGYNSIGFFTKKFTQFERNDWNHGKNYSVQIGSNGWFVTSECFDKSLRYHYSNPLNNWYKSNDEIIVKIDTSKMKAIVWNSALPNFSSVKDMDVEHNNPKYKRYYWKFDLPKDIQVALMISIGTDRETNTHTFTIIDHKTEYIR